jgi:MFS family permease
MLVARMAPMVLFGTVAGAVVESMDRRRVQIGACVLMTLGAGSIAATAATEIITLPLLAGIAFLNGLGWSMDFPVRRALLGNAVETEQLGNAMSFDTATNSATRMIGPLIGGVLYQILGLEGAYVIATFVYALTIVFALGLASPQSSSISRKGENLLSRLNAGVGYVRRNNVITSVFVITVILNLFGFCYASILPVWAVENFQADPVFVGLLASAEGGGAFLGAIILAFWARTKHFKRLFLAGAALFLGGLLIASKLTFYGAALLALFGAGVGIPAFGAMQSTLVLKEASHEFRSRVMGVLAACIGAAPFGVLNIGFIAELTSGGTAIAFSSTLGLASIIFVTWRLPSIWR